MPISVVSSFLPPSVPLPPLRQQDQLLLFLLLGLFKAKIMRMKTLMMIHFHLTVVNIIKLKDTYLLLGGKVMTNLDSILKNRDITLPTKVHLVKAMVFPVVMYGCESWTIKKAEC